MFCLQLLPHLLIVALIANAKINCSANDESVKTVDKCLKDDGLIQFYSNHKLLWINAIIAVGAVAIVVCKKKDKDPLSNSVAISCWAAQTIGLCQIAGYFAAQSADARMVVVAEIAALSLAIIAFFCGGKLINYTVGHEVRSLGSMFLVLSFLLIIVLIVSSILDLPGMQSRLILAGWIVLAMAFLILDTQLIIGGYYVDITEDDYVFASMKLFADFVLIFQRIFQAC